MGHSTQKHPLLVWQNVLIFYFYFIFLHLNLDHIIRLPFDFMNTYKWQLIFYIFLFSFFVQLFQDHMYNFLSLVLPSLAILNVFMK